MARDYISRYGVLTALALAPAASAQIQTAGDLQVELNAADWTGTGFWSEGGNSVNGDNWTAVGTPRKDTINGAVAIVFDGSDAFRSSLASSISGAANRTVEVWAYQGALRNEETLVAWSRRGGGDNTNESFNWGASNEWGAHGGWGANADVGWNPTPGNNPGNSDTLAGTPTLGQWHHLVYTYDGTTLSFYDNGVLKNSAAAPLTTHAGYQYVIGSQNTNAATPGASTTDNVSFAGAIGQVRVHDGVLTPAQITNNYNFEVGAYSAPTAGYLTTGPVNRYTFDGLASGADGTVVTDVVAGNDAVVRGANATVNATGIDLPGGANTNAYIDLPNGIISSKTNVTLQAWVTTQSTQNWSRIMDFGTSSAGEVTTAGGAHNGTNYVFVGQNGTSTTLQFERNGAALPASPLANGNARQSVLAVDHGTEHMITITFDDAADEWRFYRDGNLMEVIPDTNALSAVPDVNNWLGRSNWGGDANLDGIFNEFRVYDYALSQAQVRGDFLAGPNAINLAPVPEPTSTVAAALAAGALLSRRRRRQA